MARRTRIVVVFKFVRLSPRFYCTFALSIVRLYSCSKNNSTFLETILKNRTIVGLAPVRVDHNEDYSCMRQNKIQHLSSTNFHKLSGDPANGHILFIALDYFYLRLQQGAAWDLVTIFSGYDDHFNYHSICSKPAPDIAIETWRLRYHCSARSSCPDITTASALKRVGYPFLTETRSPASSHFPSSLKDMEFDPSEYAICQIPRLSGYLSAFHASQYVILVHVTNRIYFHERWAESLSNTGTVLVLFLIYYSEITYSGLTCNAARKSSSSFLGNILKARWFSRLGSSPFFISNPNTLLNICNHDSPQRTI